MYITILCKHYNVIWFLCLNDVYHKYHGSMLAVNIIMFVMLFLLRLTTMRAVEVLYKPKDQQGCQRRYTTSETLATMARKCQRRRRVRMRSKVSSSCARLQAGTLASTSSVW
jgi:hypothetical protein